MAIIIGAFFDQRTQGEIKDQHRLLKAKGGVVLIFETCKGVVFEQSCFTGTGIANNQQERIGLIDKADHLFRVTNTLLLL